MEHDTRSPSWIDVYDGSSNYLCTRKPWTSRTVEMILTDVQKYLVVPQMHSFRGTQSFLRIPLKVIHQFLDVRFAKA